MHALSAKHDDRLIAAWLAIACAGLLQAQRTAVDSAWDLIAKGRRAEAITLLRNAVKEDPRNADARLLLGSALMEAGERSESVAQLREAVRLRHVWA